MDEYRINKELVPIGDGRMRIEVIVKKKAVMAGNITWLNDQHFIASVSPPGPIARWFGDTFEKKCESVLINLISQAQSFVDSKIQGKEIANKLVEKHSG